MNKYPICSICYKSITESEYDRSLSEAKTWNDGYSQGMKQGNKEAKEIIQKLVKALEYYEKYCDACNYSGVDESEFSAKGCPSCNCIQARVALKEYRGEE